nr:aspergillopepsin I (EC 3.4.23.18) - Aspergillus niger (fragments) [Aspergillus niger]
APAPTSLAKFEAASKGSA